MKVYTRVVINIDTLQTIEENSFQYNGSVALCKGGGSSTTTTVDPVFNAGMLELSQEQQGWAERLYNLSMYGVEYNPSEEITGYYDASGNFVESDGVQYEERSSFGNTYFVGTGNSAGPNGEEIVTVKRGDINGYDPDSVTSEMEYMQQLIESNARLLPEQERLQMAQMGLENEQTTAARELLPLQTELQRSQIGLQGEQTSAARELLPIQTELAKLEMSDTTAAITERAPVRSAFYSEALNGVDVNERMGMAQADAAQAASSAERTAMRNAARSGVNATDVDFSGMATDRAKMLAQARTNARTQAEAENFDRLRTAMEF